VIYHAMVVDPASEKAPSTYFHRDGDFTNNISYYAG
jgi:hypothetical protein